MTSPAPDGPDRLPDAPHGRRPSDRLLERLVRARGARVRGRARGATGATSNPSIVLEVLRKERSYWTPRIAELAAANPSWTEVDITWAVIEEMAVRGAAVLEPVFVREGGRKGRLSLQTNPANYPNTERMLEQGLRFASLAPNIQVKFPATRAGIAGDRGRRPRPGSASMPRSASRSPQAIAVAEAVERGLDALRGGRRRMRPTVTPVCTIMVGRARRLDAGPRRARRHRRPPRRARLGRDRRVQAGRTASSASAATGRGCWPRPTGTASTGPSSSAATSS